MRTSSGRQPVCAELELRAQKAQLHPAQHLQVRMVLRTVMHCLQGF